MWWPAEGGQPGFLTSLWTLEGQDLLAPLITATPFGRVLGARRGAKCFVLLSHLILRRSYDVRLLLGLFLQIRKLKLRKVTSLEGQTARNVRVEVQTQFSPNPYVIVS